MPDPVAINRPMNAREWSLLLALATLWGGSFFFIALGVRELPPMTVVFVRVAIAAAILMCAVKMLRLEPPGQDSLWGYFFVLALFGHVIPFSLISWGQTHIASGVASIINGATPFFTVVIAHYFTSDERLTPGRIAGVLIGIGGIAFMVGGEALSTLGGNVAGELAVVGASIAYAIAAIVGRRASKAGIPPLVTAARMLTSSAVMMFALTMIFDRPWTLASPSSSAILAVLGLAIPCTALAYNIFFRLLASAGPTNLTLVTFLIPIVSIVLGVNFLGETLEWRHVGGMAMIGLGLAAIDGRLWRMARSRLVHDSASP